MKQAAHQPSEALDHPQGQRTPRVRVHAHHAQGRPSLLEGDVGAHLRRLALPLAWGMLALTSFAVADTFFISRLGTRELAALGFCLPVLMFFMGLVFGLSVGTTSAVARVYGEGDFEKVRRLCTDALSLTVLLQLAAAALGMLFSDPVFRLMGAREELMPLIHRYMVIWYCGWPFLGLMMMGNACIRAMGDTRFVSRMMTTLAALNVALDPFLIFGLGPFPRMGMPGAAATHVFANYLTCMISLYVLIFRRRVLQPRVLHDGLTQSWRRILHVAVPSVISNQIAPVSAAIITYLAAAFGKEAVAALGVATRIESVPTLVFYATGASVSIFTGQNFGAGNYGRIQEVVRTGSRYALAWGVIVAALLWASAGVVAPWFDSNAAVQAYTTQYLRWVPVSYGAMGVMVISNAALNGMGRPLPATTLILLKAIVLYIPLAWVLQARFGFQGILMALAVTNVTVGLLSYVWNRKIAS
jgi:putative MATE family efflux protein